MICDGRPYQLYIYKLDVGWILTQLQFKIWSENPEFEAELMLTEGKSIEPSSNCGVLGLCSGFNLAFYNA